ncbi:MAG: arginyltransferase, partial [Planctomycetota bacterium]|nr:arginyltransferase [Planctomycetota bacterium]
MPLQFPLAAIHPTHAESLLATGYRRSGKFLYRTSCSQCTACEPIRVIASQFTPNRSQKRALKKGNSELSVSIGRPICDEEHVALFNRHRNDRGLNRHGVNVDLEEYRMFLVDSCLDSFEISYFYQDQFVGAAIFDQAADSISAVYTYFDPDYSRLSLGVYSVIKQVEYCLDRGLRFLYLGYFVDGSPHMLYKQNYRPHQRLQEGKWVDYP